MDKPFLTYEGQINKLIEKGVDIPDAVYAIRMLKCNSYFSMITGYKKPFKNNDGTYKKGTSFNDIYALYKFDENLRHIFLEYILIVERKIKSLLSYSFSEKFGSSQTYYLDVNNFDYSCDNTDKRKAIDKLVSLLKNKTTPPFQYKYTAHQYEAHKNIPLWVMVKTLSFGNISKMYSLSLPNIKTGVSKEFANIRENELERMIDLMSRFRNICAHDERLYDFRLNKKSIPDMEVHSKLGIKKENGKYRQGKNDLFSLLICLKYLIDKEQLKELCEKINEQINNLCKASSLLPLSMLYKKTGFPNNWRDITELTLTSD